MRRCGLAKASLAALLREAGPRADLPPDVARQVRVVVEAEWRAVVAARQPRSTARRWPAFALAASVAVAAIAIWFALPALNSTPIPLATLSRVSGAVESGSGTDWQPVAVRQMLHSGQSLVTGPHGMAALSLRKGISLRLDADTRIALVSPGRIVVDRGAVYLDAGAKSGMADPLVIESRFGTIRHLGTQYEVRVAPQQMLVSVREGRVEVFAAGRTTQAQAGEQLVLAANGHMQRQAVSLTAAQWDWTQEVTPPFCHRATDTAGIPGLGVARGQKYQSASPQVESTAAQIVLRGSIAGLKPDAALVAVMATTPLEYTAEGALISVRAR
jgi:ferric-dicitrate binding protein FerR (iron transport regulator)